MEPEDIAGYIDNLRGRFAELEERMADPAIYARGAEFRSVSQEHRKLGALFEKFESWKKALSELADNREMLTVEEDGEMRDLLTADIASLEEKSTKLEEEIQVSLLPPDSRGSFSALICTLPKNRVGRLRFSTSPTRISAASRTCRFRSPDAMSFR